MKRAALILAALAAIMTAAAAPVRTATENFVTKKIAEAVAATTNVVCNIVTNEVHSFGGWVEEWDPPRYGSVYSFSGPYYEGGETWSGFYGPKNGMGVDKSLTAVGDEFATRLVFVEDLGETSFTLTLTRSHVTENALGLARMSDLIAHTNRTDNPHGVTAAQVGAYTKAEVDAKVENAVLPTDPTFSNAVLAVGLNIDTNSVAVLNEIASTFGGFPIEGTATTVGGLLAALAAAIAWLRKNKADKATTLAGYGITDAATMASLAPEYSPLFAYAVGEFVYHDGNIYQCKTSVPEGGEAWNDEHWELRKLGDFFTESNSLLTSRVNNLIDAKVGDVNAVLAAALDGTEVA